MATAPAPHRRNLGNVRKIDYLMSPERDFEPRPQGAEFRYVMCSTPRCGSNLVGDMLHDSGLAGDPQEYLNARYIAGYLRANGGGTTIELKPYQQELETRRTSPNGVFGVKIHFEHVESLWKSNMAAAATYLRKCDRFLLLTRRDKLAQAVSLYKARETQIWSSLDYQFLDKDDPRLSIKPEFNAVQILHALTDLVQQETRWRALLEACQLPYTEVVYEDFVADYVGQSRKLLEVLGLDPDKAKAAPGLRKQGTDNDPMIARIRDVIGVGAGSAPA
jgi:LPS sulfotransferase NodH